MRIQHNIPAMNAYRNYSNNTSALSKNLEKLSSGYKINRAGDDAAGLAISEKMRAQITGLNAAQKNVKDGVSLVKTAEGAMQEIHDMLNRMDYLATQSANGTYDNEVDRLNLQKEVDSLKAEINRIADSANFNGIKLLDGSLGEKVTDTMTIPTESINMADGITINSPVDGAGQNAAMKITFNGDEAKFGAGDSIAFDLTDADGNVTTKTFTFGNGGFTGDDFSTQMTNLATAINADSDISAEYTASVVTEKVTGEDGVERDEVVGIEIKANDMTVPNNTIGNVVATDKQLTASATTSKVGSNDTGTATKAQQGWDELFGTATGATEIKPGDEITFEFEINGKAMTVTARAKDPANPDAENEFEFGATISDTVANMVSVLNNANFDDDPDTAVDESLLKVSDYLEFKANTKQAGTANSSGSIQVVSKTTDSDKIVEATGLKINGTAAAAPTGTAGAAANGDAVAQISNVTVGGMAAGDSFRLSGTLRDGRTFTVDLTAGDAVGDNKFDMDDGSAAKIAAGIIAALKDAGTEVTITNPATNEDEIVTADKLFAGDNSLEFKVTAGANNSIDITSSIAGAPGKGVAGSITSATALNGPKLTATATPTAAKVPSASENSLTFTTDENGKLLVEQGTTLTIDGKTYEFVDGSGDGRFKTHEDNIAVSVDGLNAGTATVEDLANALRDAIGAEYTSADSKKYDVTAEGGTVTIKSQADDGTGTALEVTMGSSKPSTTLSINGGKKEVLGVEEETDISSVKAGDTVTINGKVYEFTAGKRTKNEDAVQVDISGIDTASGVAEKLAEAVNGADEKIIARADGKDVIFTSKYNAEAVKAEDAYAAPKVELPKTSNSLTLQIGDTADKFNQMSVEVGDMHTKAMGIDSISVATQEGAQAAIDVIKNAINYVSGVRGDLGAVQNRLDHTANNLSVMAENIQDAESTIRDTDVAEEMMSYVKNNILVQSAQAMLAQANQLPQGVLQLLG